MYKYLFTIFLHFIAWILTAEVEYEISGGFAISFCIGALFAKVENVLVIYNVVTQELRCSFWMYMGIYIRDDTWLKHSNQLVFISRYSSKNNILFLTLKFVTINDNVMASYFRFWLSRKPLRFTLCNENIVQQCFK